MKPRALGRCTVSSVACLLAALIVSGCAPVKIDTLYGRRSGSKGGDSVNGTAVLSEMFRRAGFRVSSWQRLSPKLDDFAVIVWVPDEFAAPGEAAREFFDEWLAGDPQRVLIYVGRDYDASIAYWSAMQQGAPADQVLELARRYAGARAELDARRAMPPQEEDAEWFTMVRGGARRKIDTLSGPWSKGVDAGATEIEIGARFTFPRADRATWRRDNGTLKQLLTSRDDSLVAEITRPNGSRIVLVNNGSFLLNLPLVNLEHRKLAARLIGASGPPKGRRVAFLETGQGEPLILDAEPNEAYPTGLELFTVWPLGIIVLHLTLMGILCCFALFPIFGRPREREAASGLPSQSYAATQVTLHEGEAPVTAVRVHFGKHIDALGELLERTGNRGYAVERLKYYHEHVRRDAGTS